MRKTCFLKAICDGRSLIKYLLMLKLTAAICFIFSFQAFAVTGLGQKLINLELRNVPIETVLKNIEAQGAYRFVYKDEILPKSKLVSVTAKNAKLDFVMQQTLDDTGISYRLMKEDMVVLIKAANNTAEKIVRVTGVVKDAEGTPLAGVSVFEKGTTNGVASDGAGNFVINVRDNNAVLVFTSTGYQTLEMQVSRYGTRMQVVMTKGEVNLDEVVVIGYGQTTRRNLTTAQTTVTEKDIAKTVNTTFDQALQGRSAGVQVTTNSAQPGGGITVNIRGISSLNATTEPLYVVDGVQIQPGISGQNTSSSLNSLAFLNPSDIESMEVLQGPSATAIFGSRATNGVVMITTKRGKTGSPKVNYDFLYTLQDKPAELPVMNLQEWVIMNNRVRRQRGEAIPVEQQDSSIVGPGTNWQDAIFRRAPLVKHQVSVSGGTEATKYYLSGERFQQEGVVKGSAFDRTGVRLNLDNTVRRWLKLGANFSYNQTNDDVGTTVVDAVRYAFHMPPYVAVKNPDGSYGGYNQLESQYGDKRYDLNPFAKAELMKYNVKRSTLMGGLTGVVDIFKGLQFRTNFNFSKGNNTTTNYIPTYQIGYTKNDKAQLNLSYGQSFYWNWNQLLEYNLYLFKDHHITLMASHEAQESTWEGMSGMRQSFPVDFLPGGEIPSIGLGDALGQQLGGYKGWNAMESYLGRLNYNYKNRYLITATYRRDGSVNFGYNNRWGAFPSASVAWRVSEEPFMESQNVISDLKLRFETGTTGNQGSGQGIFSPLGPRETPWGNGFLATQYSNPDLQWESTLTNNFGFNIGFFNNRIMLDGDIYVKKTDNLLMRNPLPYYMGTENSGSIASPWVNVGALKNNGWAITLNTINIRKSDLRWTSNFNISHNVNKIVKFYQETGVIDNINWKAGGGFIQRSAVGRPAMQFWGYYSDGIFRTLEEVNASAVPANNNQRIPTNVTGVYIGDYKYKDINGDGLITVADMGYIGNPYPKYTFGFSNDITWKALSLSVLMTGSYGNDIYNAFYLSNINPYRVYTYNNALKDAMNFARITSDANGNPVLENPDATVARYDGGNGNFSRASDLFIEDGSYVRVKNVTLTYQVPPRIVNLTKIVSGLRLSFGIQNLYTFTKYRGYDPEVGADIGNNSDRLNGRSTFGVDVGQYPQTRSYNFNIGITF